MKQFLAPEEHMVGTEVHVPTTPYIFGSAAALNRRARGETRSAEMNRFFHGLAPTPQKVFNKEEPPVSTLTISCAFYMFVACHEYDAPCRLRVAASRDQLAACSIAQPTKVHIIDQAQSFFFWEEGKGDEGR